MSELKVTTTGHNAAGESVFVPGPELKTINPFVRLLYGSSDGAPINLNGDADLAAFTAHDHTASLIPTQGSVVLSVEWPPSTDSMARIHRTLSVDVGVMVKGEIECHLDSGESRVIRQGELLIQRGTKHAWVNPSSTGAARMICFVLPSKPFDGAKD